MSKNDRLYYGIKALSPLEGDSIIKLNQLDNSIILKKPGWYNINGTDIKIEKPTKATIKGDIVTLELIRGLK